MTKYILVFVFGCFLAPLLSYSLNLFRLSDLAVSLIVFFPSLWSFVGINNYREEKNRQNDISLSTFIALGCVSFVLVMINVFVQINYFYHWFTL